MWFSGSQWWHYSWRAVSSSYLCPWIWWRTVCRCYMGQRYWDTRSHVVCYRCYQQWSWFFPNITLGYDIRDTCLSEKIGLDESSDIVLANDSESCLGNSERFLPAIMAVIGPLESHISVPIASFFRILQMPQVSYASFSSKLNNRNTYRYFFRTFPPTDSQVQVIIDVILHYE